MDATCHIEYSTYECECQLELFKAVIIFIMNIICISGNIQVGLVCLAKITVQGQLDRKIEVITLIC